MIGVERMTNDSNGECLEILFRLLSHTARARSNRFSSPPRVIYSPSDIQGWKTSTIYY